LRLRVQRDARCGGDRDFDEVGDLESIERTVSLMKCHGVIPATPSPLHEGSSKGVRVIRARP